MSLTQLSNANIVPVSSANRKSCFFNGGDDGTRTRGLCRDSLWFRGNCARSAAPIASFGALRNCREVLLHPNLHPSLNGVLFCSSSDSETYRGFTPKAYKEREIRIRAKLAKNLKGLGKRSRTKAATALPDRPMHSEARFPRLLKAYAQRAGLDNRQPLAA
jgi:hypothetical protein